MHTRLIAALTALSTPIVAQIPTDAVLTFESTQLLEPYYKLVDVLGRGTTTLLEQNAFMAVTSVAVDPDTNAQFFWTGAANALPGVYRSQVKELAKFGQGVWGPWSKVAVTRVAVGSNRVVTLNSTGLVEAYVKPTGQTSQVLSFTVPGATDLAVTGDLVYTVSPNNVIENNLASGSSRTIGSYSGALSIAVTTNAQQLTVGTVSGDLVRIDAATGTVVATQPTGLGALTAVGYTRFNTLVWTDGIALYSELNTGPLYTSPTSILDFSVATAMGPSVSRFGAGCGTAANVSWTSNSLPTLGNTTFELGIDAAPASSPALLALGYSRTSWSAANLPLPFDLQALGAPGCRLLADPQFSRFLVTDAAGAATQTIAIPNSAGLAGIEIAGQWFIPDPAVGVLGVAASEGATAVIQ